MTLFTPEVDGWVYIEAGALQGWVWRQDGKVVFTAVASDAPAADPAGRPAAAAAMSADRSIRADQNPVDVGQHAHVPDEMGADVGDLHQGDMVTMYTPEVNGWVFVNRGDVRLGVAAKRQSRRSRPPSTTRRSRTTTCRRCRRCSRLDSTC